MKHLRWLICMVVLLMGCSPSVAVKVRDFDSTYICGHQSFAIDGVTYGTAGGYGKKDGKLYSLLLIFPDDQHYFPAVRWLDESPEPQGQIHVQKEKLVSDEHHRTERTTWGWSSGNQKPLVSDGKIADVPFNHVYFIDDEKIVFQASNEELGLDFPDTIDHTVAMRLQQQLEPILKKMIRENITPQEEKE